MKDLIYCQRQIPKEQWRYGLRTSAATGCGWIATYNALRLLGYRAEPEKLIRFYEWQLPLIHGNCGTSFWGPAVFFRTQGFPVEMECRRERFDALVEQNDVCILYYWWRRDWRLGAHFVTLHKTDRGIVGYNTYRNSTGPDRYGESLQAFLKERKYFGAVLLGIRGKGDTGA